jgi:hypothetical protein
MSKTNFLRDSLWDHQEKISISCMPTSSNGLLDSGKIE